MGEGESSMHMMEGSILDKLFVIVRCEFEAICLQYFSLSSSLNFSAACILVDMSSIEFFFCSYQMWTLRLAVFYECLKGVANILFSKICSQVPVVMLGFFLMYDCFPMLPSICFDEYSFAQIIVVQLEGCG